MKVLSKFLYSITFRKFADSNSFHFFYVSVLLRLFLTDKKI